MATIELERPVGTWTTCPCEGPTLEDVISGAWEELSAHRAAACPICDGPMVARYGSGPSAVGGRCRGCRTELS